MERPAIEVPTVEITNPEVKKNDNGRPLVGKTLDRYEILTLLGEGGMGQVYLAQDTKLRRKVALKLLSDQLTTNEKLLRRFEQEALTASSLNHPNIITIYDIGQVGSLHLIATEYIEGDTLRHRMSQSKLTIEEAMDIAIQAASALAAAHRAGILHRDIKPHNIMVRPDGHIKVIDFGLAKLFERQASATGDESPRITMVDTEPGVVMGTPYYMSPEQARCLPLDERTDIFSFGSMLYEMIAGVRPFQGATISDVIAAILTREPEPLARHAPDLPSGLEQIVGKALIKDVEGRYQKIEHLLRDLKELKLRLEKKAGSTQDVTPSPDYVTPQVPGSNPNNLPVQFTSFVGREGDIAAVSELLRGKDTRLVTLNGTGGVGKTRLALQVAANLISHFEDGVYFVSLDSISDPGLVVSVITRTLGIREVGSTPLLESLKEYLKAKDILLILDNFEQVISVAPLLTELFATSPRLKILVTSREPLRLRGEKEFAVQPLALPHLRQALTVEALLPYPAVELFVQRAIAVKSNFALTAENAQAVAEICIRLDGLPLAIELAAARIKILPPQAILARLESRLKLLTRGTSDLPTRQQTMRSAIAWSYDLLDEEEKRVFRQLAIFVGGFTLEAAEAVCGDRADTELSVLDAVSSLIDKSLLRQAEKDELRFGMLETIREFGLDLLRKSGEFEELRHAYALFFLNLVEEAEPELKTSGQVVWLERLEADRDNLRAALRWSKESGEAETGLRMAAAPWRFWETHGPLSEGRKWLEDLLEMAETAEISAAVRAKALYGAGVLAHIQNDYVRARMHLERGLDIYRALDQKQGVASSLNTLGLLAHDQGDDNRALKLLEEGLALCRELDDKHGIAYSLGNLGLIAQDKGNYELAISLQEESVKIRRELGDKLGTAASLNNVGLVALDHGYYDRASKIFEQSLKLFREMEHKLGTAISLNNLGEVAQLHRDNEGAAALFAESLSIFREVGDKRNIATLLNNLGNLARYGGDLEQAKSLHTESLALLKEVGEKASIAFCMEGLAGVALAQGQPERAAKLFGGAEALRKALDTPLPPARLTDYDRDMAEVRAAMGEESFSSVWLEGQAMTLEQALNYAIE